MLKETIDGSEVVGCINRVEGSKTKQLFLHLKHL